MKKAVLHISPDFDYACGVSRHVYLLLKYLKKDLDHELYFLTNRGDSFDRLYEINIVPMTMFFLKGPLNILFFIPNLIILIFICIRYKIKIIHTHHRYPEFLAVLVSRLLNIQTVTTVHSLVSGYKFISFKSDKIISVSNAVKKHLINRYNVSDEKIFQIYNFVENISGRNIEKSDIEKNNLSLLFIGRMNYQKGFDVLLKALEVAGTKGKGVNLTAVGVIGDDLDDLIKNFRSLKLNIHNPAESLEDYYQKCDIVVIPSREDPFPYTMIEAGLYQKPVIGSKVDGIPEYLKHGLNGLLVASGDYKDMAEKIILLYNNPDKMIQLGKHNFQSAQKYLNAEEYILKLNVIYKELLKRK